MLNMEICEAKRESQTGGAAYVSANGGVRMCRHAGELMAGVGCSA
jgi:hypothetical protein